MTYTKTHGIINKSNIININGDKAKKTIFDEDDKDEKFVMEEEDKNVEQEEISDITYEGYMQKKTHSTWQKRYFQIKGGYLYWFKDKTSSVVQNKISIKNDAYSRYKPRTGHLPTLR